MISVLELRERAREWSLREDIVEKDYALGWLLWGIASEALTNTWVFKGGTCLKKCAPTAASASSGGTRTSAGTR